MLYFKKWDLKWRLSQNNGPNQCQESMLDRRSLMQPAVATMSVCARPAGGRHPPRHVMSTCFCPRAGGRCYILAPVLPRGSEHRDTFKHSIATVIGSTKLWVSLVPQTAAAQVWPQQRNTLDTSHPCSNYLFAAISAFGPASAPKLVTLRV